MANYAITNSNTGSQQNMSTSFKSIVSVNASNSTALVRGKVYDILIGSGAAPADNEINWDLSRITAAGTATASTPNALDPADSASLMVGFQNYLAEPTVTASSSVWYVAVNQRASYRWVAAPGSEFVFPATNLAGFALRAASLGFTSTVTGSLLVAQQ